MSQEQRLTPKPWHRFWRGDKPKGLDGRYHKVINVENDGEYANVQFVREDGEIVVGTFRRIGWRWAPSAERAEMMEMLSKPPIVVARGRKTCWWRGDHKDPSIALSDAGFYTLKPCRYPA